jgi:hypothetical protein
LDYLPQQIPYGRIALHDFEVRLEGENN